MTDPMEATGRGAKGQFTKGHKFSTGRKVGARVKFSENFLEALRQDFKAHGKDVIKIAREKSPVEYLKVCAALVPKAMQIEAMIDVEHTHNNKFDIQLNDFSEAMRRYGAMIGVDQKLIEIWAKREEQEADAQLVELEVERDDDE